MEPLPVSKFIESLPKKVIVYNMRWRGTYRGIQKRLAIAEYLKEMGVHSARSVPETIDVVGYFRNGQKKEKMVDYIQRIAKSYNIPESKFHVVGITLMDDKQTSSLTFKRMFKQIKLPNDKRRKKIVLGMTSGDGSNYHDMLAGLSAKKITCTLAKTEKTIVMCSEEVVMKKDKS
jgi:hypothetical protein